MSHDCNIANDNGANVRADINALVADMVSWFYSATAPDPTLAYMKWVDTSASPARVKVRNGTNTAWVVLPVSITESGVILLDERTAPTTGAGQGAVVTMDQGGQPELFFREENNGDLVQITTGGVLKIAGAASQIKLDDLGTPDDNTDLDATTARHGLLPKLGGSTTSFLRADGTWAAVGGGGGGQAFGLAQEASATSTSFTTLFEIKIQVPSAGKTLTVQYRAKSSGNGENHKARIYADILNSETGWVALTTSYTWKTALSLDCSSLSAGWYTFSFQMLAANGAVTSYCDGLAAGWS